MFMSSSELLFFIIIFQQESAHCSRVHSWCYWLLGFFLFFINGSIILRHLLHAFESIRFLFSTIMLRWGCRGFSCVLKWDLIISQFKIKVKTTCSNLNNIAELIIIFYDIFFIVVEYYIFYSINFKMTLRFLFIVV